MLRPNESMRLVIKNGEFTSVLILTVYSLLKSIFFGQQFHVHFLFFRIVGLGLVEKGYL